MARHREGQSPVEPVSAHAVRRSSPAGAGSNHIRDHPLGPSKDGSNRRLPESPVTYLRSPQGSLIIGLDETQEGSYPWTGRLSRFIAFNEPSLLTFDASLSFDVRRDGCGDGCRESPVGMVPTLSGSCQWLKSESDLLPRFPLAWIKPRGVGSVRDATQAARWSMRPGSLRAPIARGPSVRPRRARSRSEHHVFRDESHSNDGDDEYATES